MYEPILSECSPVTLTTNYTKSLRLILVLLGFIPSISYAHDYTQRSQDQYINHQIRTAYDQMDLRNSMSYQAFYQGYMAYINTNQATKPYLTIVDYALPSTEKRLFIMNLQTNQLVERTWVAQGENTGLLWAKDFSNRFGTHQSSLGVFVTGKAFYGSVGYSLRIHGLTPGENTNAYNRDIVVHGASYVSPQFIAEHGYLGRSWGCLALPLNRYRNIINIIKGGSVIYSYV